MPSSMRLQSFLSRSGICSRRAAIALLASKNVVVNDVIVTDAGFRVIPGHDSIFVSGNRCTLRTEHRYFLFHKPTLVESTNTSKRKQKTAREYLLPYYKEHLFCAGRLDFMSSGLMLYTTDGDLTYRLTHPKYRIEKTYVVHSAHSVPKHVLTSWQKGLKIQNVLYKLKHYQYFSKTKHMVRLTLCEGKNREIRVVFAHASIPIKTLHRITLGPFSLGNIETGQVQQATEKTIRKAYELTKLSIAKNSIFQ